MNQWRSASPRMISRKIGNSAPRTVMAGSWRGPGAGEAQQPVERALQDVGGRMLVDDFGAPGSAHIGGDEVALDRGGRQPLVPQADRQRGQLRQIARKCA